MTFEIIDYLNNAALEDKELRKQIICIHDNLYTAYKILESVKSAGKLQEPPSEKVLLTIFHELQKTLDNSD